MSDGPDVVRASWILPISRPPVRDGWLAVRDGRIAAAGRWPPPAGLPAARDLGRVAVLPGLVNAHTHLELSWMRGRIPPAASMPAWAGRLIDLRRQAGDDPAAMADAITELRAAGTAVVGDVSNTLASCGPLSVAGCPAVVFHELMGLAEDEEGARAAVGRAQAAAEARACGELRVSVAPHAPYSVSPALFAAIRALVLRRVNVPTTVHLAESEAEIELLERGTGPWRDLLARRGIVMGRWTPPGCRPVEYLARLGFLDLRPLVVHGLHLRDWELGRLRDHGCVLVTCPRSAIGTGAGEPPIARFYRSGIAVAIGTDSLASAPDLNLFAELAELRRRAPEVGAARLLDSATRQGARALGFGADYGTIDPGRRAALIAVRIPDRVEDVEEYLVSGVAPEDVSWVD